MTVEAPASGGDTSAARPGPWARYRQRYVQLPPAVQMIGLQLWLPLLFVLAFCLCYVNAFHQPNPRDIPVAVVGTGPAADTFAQRLQDASGGVLAVSTVGSVGEVRGELRSGDLAAVFTPGSAGTPARLTLTSAEQFQLAQVARQSFAPVAAAQGTTLAVDDLAPLPRHDAYGTSLFYAALLWTIPAYMVGMFVGMMGAALRHRVRLGIIAGSGFVLSGLSALLVGPVLGAVHGHFPQLWLLGFAAALAVGLLVNGLAYFFGRFVSGAAMVIFVFLSVPSSGGAFPASFLPEPFRALHPYVFATGLLDALRDVVYGVGPGVGQGALIIGCYAAAGVLLTAVGRPYYLRLTARRAANGRPMPMMQAAQRAMAAASMQPAGAVAAAGGGSAGGAVTTAAGSGRRADPAARGREDDPRTEGYRELAADSDAAAVTGAAAGGGAA